MNNLLYYYTNEENKLRILASGKITLSPIRNTNDPFECIGGALIETMSYKNKNLDEKYLSEFLAIAKNPKARYLCMSLNHPLSIFGTLMWRRYADAHKGACFVIKPKFRFNEIVSKEVTSNDWHHGHIKYLPTRDLMKGSFQGTCNTIYNGISPFGIKDVEWVHEREYRFTLHNSNEEFPYLCETTFPFEIIGNFEYQKDKNKNPTDTILWRSKSQHPFPEEPRVDIILSSRGQHMQFLEK